METEALIWKELLKIARGMQTVHDAAKNIAGNMPKNLERINEDVRHWFIFGI